MRERRVTLHLRVWSRLRGARAQTAAEYLGVLLVVAAIIAAIAWTDPGHAISGKLSELVHDISGER